MTFIWEFIMERILKKWHADIVAQMKNMDFSTELAAKHITCHTIAQFVFVTLLIYAMDSINPVGNYASKYVHDFDLD